MVEFDPEVFVDVELVVLSTQARFDIAQAFPVGQLGERHPPVLILTSKSLYVLIATVALNTAPKRMHR